MRYTTAKRFKRNGIDGYFNIPYGTELEEHDDILWYKDRAICVTRSAAAHEYFVSNDDDNGTIRWKLSRAIINTLGGFSNNLDKWNKIFDDETAQKYRRPEHQDYWLWNHDFYNAPIEDLEHIATLIGAKV